MVWIESLIFLMLLVTLAPLLGIYMSQTIVAREAAFFPRLQKIETFFRGLCKIDLSHRMNWMEYLKAVLLFNAFGFVLLFGILTFQSYLPWNPEGFPGLPWPLAFNIAASFVTNTNWQSYAGETTLSYFSQMVGLTVQNFLSAATGLAVLLALIRGLKASLHATLGNFWCDLLRIILFLLLPSALLFSIVLMQQGVVQTLNPYVQVRTLEQSQQTIPLGPVASQEAIKLLGSNGGGFFHANSAHPFENPTPLTNFLGAFALVLIPAATIFAYGLAIQSRIQGWLIFIVMLILLAIGLIVAYCAELHSNPIFPQTPAMEGKEQRHGVFNSVAWSALTTGTSNGSFNAMIDSMSPLTSGVVLFNMMLGELIFGGVGTGLCHMIMYILLAVFLAGLMIGRTPEYLGKKIEKREMQWVIVAIFAPSACALLGMSLAFADSEASQKTIQIQGPHHFTQIIYAFTSSSANNGSAMAGLKAETPFYLLTLAFIMLISRLAIVTASLGVAGNLVIKKIMPISPVTLNTSSALFGVLLLAVILCVAVFIYFPFIALGPWMEHLLMLKGRTF